MILGMKDFYSSCVNREFSCCFGQSLPVLSPLGCCVLLGKNDIKDYRSKLNVENRGKTA